MPSFGFQKLAFALVVPFVIPFRSPNLCVVEDCENPSQRSIRGDWLRPGGSARTFQSLFPYTLLSSRTLLRCENLLYAAVASKSYDSHSERVSCVSNPLVLLDAPTLTGIVVELLDLMTAWIIILWRLTATYMRAKHIRAEMLNSNKSRDNRHECCAKACECEGDERAFPCLSVHRVFHSQGAPPISRGQ